MKKQMLSLCAAAALAFPGCLPGTQSSSDVSDLRVELILAKLVLDLLRAEGGTKAKSLDLTYDVHFIEFDAETGTCSLYLRSGFGLSTPITFPYKTNGASTKFTADKKGTITDGAAFIEERLAELTSDALTVTNVTVSGSVRDKGSDDALPGSFTIAFRVTFTEGQLQGRSFKGKMVVKGVLTDFA